MLDNRDDRFDQILDRGFDPHLITSNPFSSETQERLSVIMVVIVLPGVFSLQSPTIDTRQDPTGNRQPKVKVPLPPSCKRYRYNSKLAARIFTPFNNKKGPETIVFLAPYHTIRTE